MKNFLSTRGLSAARKPPLRYLPAILEVAHSLFHPETNKEGYIVMAISENMQMPEEMVAKMATVPTLSPHQYHYGDMGGSIALKTGIKKLIARHISPNIKLELSDIVCLAGVTSTLNAVAFALFDRGDSILSIAPFYPAYIPDFGLSPEVKVIPVRISHPNYLITRTALDNAFQEAQECNHPPKAIIVTTPSNPTGIVHSAAELETVLSWGREKNLFIISNEVYATLAFNEAIVGPGHKCCSMINVAYNKLGSDMGGSVVDTDRVLGDDIMILWGASKDLGLSGLRIGASVCQNPMVNAAMTSFSNPYQISRQSQHALAHLLNDEKWLDTHFKATRIKLKACFDVVDSMLTSLNVPFFNPGAGLFCWVDFGEFLPLYTSQSTEQDAATSLGALNNGDKKTLKQPSHKTLMEAEWLMFEDLLSTFRIALTPGSDFVSPTRDITVLRHWGNPHTWNTSAGFFRICFASAPEPVVHIAMHRIASFVKTKRCALENMRASTYNDSNIQKQKYHSSEEEHLRQRITSLEGLKIA